MSVAYLRVDAFDSNGNPLTLDSVLLQSKDGSAAQFRASDRCDGWEQSPAGTIHSVRGFIE